MSYPDDGSNPEAREILRHIPKGRDNARTAAEIAQRSGINSTDSTFPGVRKTIKQTLIGEWEKPIGSCNDGFFFITTQDELQNCLDDYNARIRGIQKKARTLKEAFESEYDPSSQPQRTLFG